MGEEKEARRERMGAGFRRPFGGVGRGDKFVKKKRERWGLCQKFCGGGPLAGTKASTFPCGRRHRALESFNLSVRAPPPRAPTAARAFKNVQPHWWLLSLHWEYYWGLHAGHHQHTWSCRERGWRLLRWDSKLPVLRGGHKCGRRGRGRGRGRGKRGRRGGNGGGARGRNRGGGRGGRGARRVKGGEARGRGGRAGRAAAAGWEGEWFWDWAKG